MLRKSSETREEKRWRLYQNASQKRLMWWRFKKHRLALASAIVLGGFYLMAALAPFISPYDPQAYNPRFAYAPPTPIHFYDDDGFHWRPFVYKLKLQTDPKTMQRTYREDKSQRVPVSFFIGGAEYKWLGLIPADLKFFGTPEGTQPVYLFGTDRIGRCLFSRIVYGARISLTIGLAGVFLSFFIGLIMGGISGYYGGWVDIGIQRLIELLGAFPGLPLWMALSAAVPAWWSPLAVYFGITVVLSVLGWTGMARVVRGFVMSIKTEDYVCAARLAGASEARIIVRHITPGFMSHIIAVLSLAVPGMILGETSLSFLGLGLRPPVVSWGVLLSQAQDIQTIAMQPWLLIPGLFVIVTVLAFSFMGDGLRDAADPYSC